MSVTFCSEDCIMLNSEQTAKECDATGFHSSNAAWHIKLQLISNV
jgi:hypothetical protein